MPEPRTPVGRVTNPPILPPYVAADFPDAEFAARLGAVREEMRRRGLAMLLIADPENIYYLLGLNHQGYFSFTLLVLPREAEPLIVARAMERPTLETQLHNCESLLYDEETDPAEATVEAIERSTAPGDTIGIGRDTMYFPVRIWDHVRDAVTDRTWKDGSNIVATVRAVKSKAEIALTRRAATISDRSVQAGIAVAGSGTTERSVAAAIYHEMMLAGSEHPGFAPFIRSSDILNQEHVTWRDRTLEPGTGLLMELSGCVYRYHAPLTRMVYIDHLPADAEPASQTALAGLAAIEKTLRPGVWSGEVYDAWQAAVDIELGHSRYRRHHCGYSVGIGFPPSWVGGSSVVGLRRNGKLPIAEGMVFHILSWILGQYAVDFCVSDTFLVTENGCEVLTTTDRSPVVVP